MIDREKQLGMIARFKKCVTLTVAGYLSIYSAGTVIRYLLPAVLTSNVYRWIGISVLVCLGFLYIYLLVLMYKTARILYHAQLLKTRPQLLLVLAIVATPIGFFINIIIVIVLWRKGNKLLSSPAQMPSQDFKNIGGGANSPA